MYWDCFSLHNCSCVPGLGMMVERRERPVVASSPFPNVESGRSRSGSGCAGKQFHAQWQYCETMVLRVRSLFVSLHSLTACHERGVSMSISRAFRVHSVRNGTPPRLPG